MNPTIVRGIEIGIGKPKICVPIIEKTVDDILQMGKRIILESVDLIEWRLDWFDDVLEEDTLIETANLLRKQVGNIPILCTFRTSNEGGEKDVSNEEYLLIYERLILSKQIDLIDVELYMGEDIVKNLIQKAHESKVKVVLSNHDFDKTPCKRVIVDRLCKMQELGGDIAKMAVMPLEETDVLTLMSATIEMKEQHSKTPVITMSMAGMGAISRVAGYFMGSAVTFGSVSKASAPGQLEVNKLAHMLEILEY